MPATNRTPEFREILKEVSQSIPEAKRRKVSKPRNAQQEQQLLLSKEYLSEAYVVLNHINNLARMLVAIRKPYLNFDLRSPPFSRQQQRTFDLSGSDQSWANIRHLNDKERDQIDLQARVILSRCSDRVKELEALEKRRQELAASQTNPLTRFLPARLRQDESTAASDFIAAHHSSITWYLSRRLAETSSFLKDMQEERVKRQLERTKTLGSTAGREAMFMTDPIPSSSSSSDTGASGNNGGGWLDNASNIASSYLGSIGGGGGDPSSSRSTPKSSFSIPTTDDLLDDESDTEELELTSSQIMQFEAENANILQNMQDTLASVQQAESRLMEISALQMELVTHLTKQTEQTEQLYEDAIATAASVEKGNVQLKEAKRRARDSRKWILLFLIGASLSLLFLHYY
ncbi:snare protein syntaxin 18/UFE1 [Panus rudis PR-1116 ss-1]|nr:snare protein syntaxin 18/UFE1 [Panus rudis PR-1116 ss-1]